MLSTARQASQVRIAPSSRTPGSQSARNGSAIRYYADWAPGGDPSQIVARDVYDDFWSIIGTGTQRSRFSQPGVTGEV
jgi:hypothetical protein